MKIAVLHATVNAVRPLEDALRAIEPKAQIVNLVNEELLHRANEIGGVDARGLRSFLRLASLASDANPDGIIIACSLYCPYASYVHEISGIPVIAVDQPMMEAALQHGGKIGILATTAASGPAAIEKLKKAANGREFETEIAIVTDAMTALKAGDINKHNLLLKKAAKKLVDKGCTVLMLTQITMACAAEMLSDLPALVLTSPQTGAQAIIRLIREE